MTYEQILIEAEYNIFKQFKDCWWIGLNEEDRKTLCLNPEDAFVLRGVFLTSNENACKKESYRREDYDHRTLRSEAEREVISSQLP